MIIFRLNASNSIGFGHIRRCTLLASLLKKKADIHFLLNDDAHAGKFLTTKKWQVTPAAKWQTVDWGLVRCVVFDLVNFTPLDEEILAEVKKRNIPTVQITDLGMSQHDVDRIIDCSLSPIFPFVNPQKVLSGPDYVILHHKFRHFNKVDRKYRQKPRKIFISLGGGVEYRLLREMIDIMTRSRYQLKISPGFCVKGSFQRILRRVYPGIHFVGHTESLARPLFEADIALITASTTAFEAAAVGTPALYFYYHKEQETIADSLEQRGTGFKVSPLSDLNRDAILAKINLLTCQTRTDMGQKGKALVDGLGAYRVIDFFKSAGII